MFFNSQALSQTNVVAANCFIQEGYRCGTVEQVCSDTDGEINDNYACTCKAPQSGKGLKQAASCVTACEKGSSETCLEANAKLTVPLKTGLSEAQSKQEDIKKALAKSMGIPVEDITSFALSDDSNGGTNVEMTVTQTGTDLKDTDLESSLVSNLNADNDDGGFLAQIGIDSGDARGAALEATSPPEEDDECFLGFSMGTGGCVAILVAIIIAGLLVIGGIIFCLTRPKANKAPMDPTNNNKNYEPQVNTPVRDEHELHPREELELRENFETDPAIEETKFLTPQRDEPFGSPQGDHDYMPADEGGVINFNDNTAYSHNGGAGRGAGRGISSFSPSVNSSPQLSRGRGQPANFLTMAETEAPGTSGWV